jgi:hypothetical protein
VLNFYSTHLAPALSAAISPGGQPEEGDTYTLTCDVQGDEALAPMNWLFQWVRVESKEWSAPSGTPRVRV